MLSSYVPSFYFREKPFGAVSLPPVESLQSIFLSLSLRFSPLVFVDARLFSPCHFRPAGFWCDELDVEKLLHTSALF